MKSRNNANNFIQVSNNNINVKLSIIIVVIFFILSGFSAVLLSYFNGSFKNVNINIPFLTSNTASSVKVATLKNDIELYDNVSMRVNSFSTSNGNIYVDIATSNDTKNDITFTADNFELLGQNKNNIFEKVYISPKLNSKFSVSAGSQNFFTLSFPLKTADLVYTLTLFDDNQFKIAQFILVSEK